MKNNKDGWTDVQTDVVQGDMLDYIICMQISLKLSVCLTITKQPRLLRSMQRSLNGNLTFVISIIQKAEYVKTILCQNSLLSSLQFKAFRIICHLCTNTHASKYFFPWVMTYVYSLDTFYVNQI